MVTETRPYINGKWVAGLGEKIAVENPANGQTIYTFDGASVTQFQEAIDAAAESFAAGHWANAGKDKRIEVLLQLVDYLASRHQDIVDFSVAEVGTPRTVTEGLHSATPVRHSREILELYRKLPEHTVNDVPLSEIFGGGPDGSVTMTMMQYEPIGVVAAITAYNAPLYINIWKVIPALAVGCSVVLRPNVLTPAAAFILAEAADAVGLPAGVLNVLVESASAGAELLCAAPGVDLVSFTGSDAVGSIIMQNAAKTLKPVLLELGGKSVQLYHEDSLHLAPAGGLGILGGIAGQGCSLPTRMVVPSTRVDEVAEACAAAAKALVIGDPSDRETTVAPLPTEAQVQRCEQLVADAVAAGARVVCGGQRSAEMPGGHFFEPTILVVPDNTNPAAQKEFFGPVLTIVGYADLDEAVAIANDSEFGLSGIVHSRDVKLGYDIASRIRTGSISVNKGYSSAFVSSGGIKRSGMGRERGVEGLRANQRIKHVAVSNPAAR